MKLFSRNRQLKFKEKGRGFTLMEMTIVLGVSLILVSLIATMIYLVTSQSNSFDKQDQLNKEIEYISLSTQSWFQSTTSTEFKVLEHVVDENNDLTAGIQEVGGKQSTYTFYIIDGKKGIKLNNGFTTELEYISDIDFECIKVADKCLIKIVAYYNNNKKSITFVYTKTAGASSQTQNLGLASFGSPVLTQNNKVISRGVGV